MSLLPKILILATGGTISANIGSQGLKPSLKGSEILKIFGEQNTNYSIEIRDILSLDSSNIQPEDWQLMAEEIMASLPHYDGIVITHGTDTMAYTSSVLSFMLRNINIPVVLTGSQLPITHPLSDAFSNLRLAIAMAASGRRGSFLAFNRKILLGTRAVKVRTTDFDAFESINAPYVAELSGDGLVFLQDQRQGQELAKPSLLSKLEPRVFLVKLIPGLSPEIFQMLSKMNYRGLVIEAFGIGGLHFLHRDHVSELECLIAGGMPVVITSQCLYERSDFSRYETGLLLKQKGAIEAFDMTSEAAVTKLMWALGQGLDLAEIKDIFARSLADEISLPAN